MNYVLITGDRNWDDSVTVKRVIDTFPDNTTVIEGRARGADSLAGYWAKQRGLPVVEFLAEWDKYGKRAGYLRNRQQLDYLLEQRPEPITCIWFHHNLEESRGTRMQVELAKAAGVPTFSYTQWLKAKGAA